MKSVDQFGNKLNIQEQAGVKSITIKLVNGQERRIGSIKGNEYFVSRIYEKHLFRKFNAYGINSWVLSYFDVDVVVLREFKHDEDSRIFRIPKQVILDEGKYLTFSDKGFEKQIFIPLDILYKYEE